MYIDPVGAVNDVVNSAIGGEASELGGLTTAKTGISIGNSDIPLANIVQNENGGAEDWSGLSQLPDTSDHIPSETTNEETPSGNGGTPND